MFGQLGRMWHDIECRNMRKMQTVQHVPAAAVRVQGLPTFSRCCNVLWTASCLLFGRWRA
jgi:hypothetical protein